MGGEQVADSSPEGEVIDRDDSPISLYTLFRTYEPLYLVYGMTHEEYWNGKNELKAQYREADRIKRKRENFNAWLQGRYFYDALGAILKGLNGKLDPYVEKPYDVVEKSPAEKEAEMKKKANIGKDNLTAWLAQNP